MIEEKDVNYNAEGKEVSKQLNEDDLENEDERNSLENPVSPKLGLRKFNDINKDLSSFREKQEFGNGKKIIEEEINSSSSGNKQDSQQEEDINPYRFRSDEWLQSNHKKINKETDILNDEDDHLTDEIARINKGLRRTPIGDQKRAMERDLEQVKADRDTCRQNIEALANQLEVILQEISRRKQEGNQAAENTQSFSIESLFVEDEHIETTILYVATFFPELSLSDFKRVVSQFLGERTISVTKSQTIVEDGKSRTVETQEEYSLAKRWQDSILEPNKADKIFKKCCLKVHRQESALVVEFSSSYLRTKCIKYFQDEQALYLEGQYKIIQEFLFDTSDHVANNAINLLAEAAIYYPNDYGAEWLLWITATAEAIESELLFERVSKLIFQMQIILEPEKVQQTIKTFLNNLLSQEKDCVFGIILCLINKQLYSNFLANKINSLKQLFDCLKQVLDRGNKKQKADAYNVVERILTQRGSHKYIYDILGILKDWLPEAERSHENYSPSNQAALLLIVSYCDETTNKLSTEKYGCWPSKYPLFKSICNDLENDSTSTDTSLNILVSLLFQPSVNQKLSIGYVLPDEIDAIQFIGFLIAEWFTILYGLQEGKLKPEASKLAKRLLHQVVIVARRLEQKQLNEFWGVLANLYLEEAANYAQSGKNNQDKRELVCRRKLVKELRNCFKVLQQETSTVI
jgi:hypothetical protein